MIDVQERQKDMFKATKDARFMDVPVSDLYSVLIAKGKEGESVIRDLNKSIKAGDKYHYMMAIRGYAKSGQWEDVKAFIQMKKPPITY